MDSSDTSQTKIKFNQIPNSPSSKKIQPTLHKLSPLPVFRKHLPNCSSSRERLSIKGHKFFGKVSAAGPQTLKILQGIKKSHSIKSIKKFEFDPYLCDQSYLNHLKRICHKIQKIKRLNLVIRRVDFPAELETFSPFVARFSKLHSFRLEFPSLQNASENGFIKLYKAIKKCFLLKSVDWSGVGVQENFQRPSEALLSCLLSLKLLESYRSFTSFKKRAIANEPDDLHLWKNTRGSKLKTADLGFSMDGEWSSLGTESDIHMEALMCIVQKLPLLQKLKMKVIKSIFNSQEILRLLTAVDTLRDFYHLEFELINCRISDLEIIAFAHGLMKAKSIKYFSLKVIQNSNISEECIEKFAGVISKFDHLLKFDLYFRRLNLHPRGILDLGNRIQNFPKLQCSCSKESIHIFKLSDP